MQCFKDLAALNVFPDAKDISESMGALQAASTHYFQGKENGTGCWRQNDVLCIVIGDGNTPRTATLLSYLTQWTSVSVDPEMGEEWVGASPKGVQRLHGVRGTFEDWVVGTGPAAIDVSHFKHLLLLSVHSHNRFTGAAAIGAIRKSMGVQHLPCCLVSVPCCHRFGPRKDIGRTADHIYEDLAIFSACRQVSVWKWAPENEKFGQ